MTAAEQILLPQEAPAGISSAGSDQAESYLHLVTDQDVEAARLAGATQELKASEFVVQFASSALSAVMRKEPYRTNPDGSRVPTWLYRYRHHRYEHDLKPATARRERAFTARAAAHTALLNLTAGAGESLWPGDLSSV